MDTGQNKKKKKLFAFNSFTGIIQLVLTAILLFISIPVFITNLGEEAYSVFCIIAIIGNLAVYSNLALDASLIKFLAEQGKCKESDHDILTMAILVIILLVPVSFLLLFFQNFILFNISGIPIEYFNEASTLYRYLVLANFLLILGRVFSAILDSRHKIYLTNLAMFIYSVLYWGGIIVVILSGYGLKEIGIAIFTAAFFWFIILLVLAFREWGKLETSDFGNHFIPLAKKQLKYSFKIYTSSILAFLYEPLTKLLISNLMGVSYIGIYDIAVRIKTQLFTIFSKMLLPLFPTIANIKNIQSIKVLIQKLTTSLFFVVIPVFVILAFCTRPFIGLWLGSENIQLISLSTIVITGACILFSVTVIPSYFFLRAKNHPDKEIYIQGTNAIVNLIVIFFTYQKLDFYSVLLGNALSFFFSFLLCLFYQKKYLNILPFENKTNVVKYILSFSLILTLTAILYTFINSTDFINIIILTLFIGTVSIILFRILKIFSKEDLSFK